MQYFTHLRVKFSQFVKLNQTRRKRLAHLVDNLDVSRTGDVIGSNNHLLLSGVVLLAHDVVLQVATRVQEVIMQRQIAHVWLL